MSVSKKKGTIKLIAEKTNVSPITVSIVLNGRGDEMRISKETQEKILEEAKKLGYQPNVFARRLKKSNQSSSPLLIGILWPATYLSDLLVRFFNGLQNCILNKKMNIETVFKPYYPSNLAQLKELFVENLFNGVIVVGTTDSDIEFLENLNTVMPIVMFNRQSSKYSCIYVDEYSLGEKVAKLFAARGHKSVGLIGPSYLNRNFSMRRVGFLDTCTKLNLSISDNHIITDDEVDTEAGRNCMKKMLSNGDLPTAIFILSSTMAYGVYSVLKENGYSIPDDVEIVGCSDLLTCELLNPKLTVIDYSIERMVYKSLNLITEMITGISSEPISLIEDSYFIFRESCGNFPKLD